MPKPMINTQNQVKNHIDTGKLSATNQSKGKAKIGNIMDKMKLDRLLRNKRSEKYMKAMRELDAGGHVNNQDQVNNIIDTIKNIGTVNTRYCFAIKARLKGSASLIDAFSNRSYELILCLFATTKSNTFLKFVSSR